MIKLYISKYVNKLSKEEMVNFLMKENIILNEKEIDFLFSYIKKNWKLIFDNQDKIFLDLKENLNITTYTKIEPILIFYKEKYKSYL